MHGASYEIRSADVLRTLDWENLETRWYLTKATFLYKVFSNSAAPILKDSFTSRNILLNNYNLRNSQTDLTLPKPNREFLKRSFKYSGAYLWNNLPLEAKQAQSIYTFKSCDLLSQTPHANTLELLDIFDIYNLTQHITEPTRVSSNIGTVRPPFAGGRKGRTSEGA